MKKKAAVLPAAKTNRQRIKQYPKATPMSSLKLAIGELLLFGNKQRKEFWLLFEALLV